MRILPFCPVLLVAFRSSSTLFRLNLVGKYLNVCLRGAGFGDDAGATAAFSAWPGVFFGLGGY